MNPVVEAAKRIARQEESGVALLMPSNWHAAERRIVEACGDFPEEIRVGLESVQMNRDTVSISIGIEIAREHPVRR